MRLANLSLFSLLAPVVVLVTGPARVAAIAPAAPAPQKAKAEAVKESQRLQKLKQVTFDRRPSAILKAWAPAGPEEKKPDEKAKPDPFDAELEAFQKSVTRGDWPAVKKYLGGLPADEAKAGYLQMLRSLQSGPMPAMPGGMAAGAGPGPAVMFRGMPVAAGPTPMPMPMAERNQFTADDLVGLIAASPKEPEKDAVGALSAILQQVVAGGTVVEGIVARFKVETTKASGGVLTPRLAARLLCGAGQAAAAGDFLPAVAKAEADKDVEALNLLARHFVGLHARENKLAFLEKAWAATQAALAHPGPRAEHEEALKRAVELAPKLRTELGEAWLAKSFSDRPERGMDILATVGAVAAQGLQSQPTDPEARGKPLELQKTAVEALLKASPARAQEWKETLSLLATNWLREGEFSQQFAQGSGAARPKRDMFGNYYFMNDDGTMPGMQPQNPNQPKPITVMEVLKSAPGTEWLDRVRDDLRPRLAMTLCQLHLKAEEEAKAFPYIERLAPTHPRPARELVNDFLRVWTKNHDPNAVRGAQNSFIWFYYGFDVHANGVPLTRSKQERNLEDLARWAVRMRKLPIGDPDEELLARAFTACHSTAEVYKMEAIEKVFGPLGSLKPKTLAGLAQQMRENLGTVWRKPEEQAEKKTNRKPKDIQVEVLRGYDVARGVVDKALAKFPDEWSLVLARAAVAADELAFRNELARSPGFAAKRAAAFGEFARAARLYAARAKDLPDEEQSPKVYEQWFYASLGACDLAQITDEMVPDTRQPGLVREALHLLPGELAEKHAGRFANDLVTRLSAIKPACKYRYLKGGFEIVGDHPQAVEAKKVFDYYKDIVTEIKLEAVPDGSPAVGYKDPFGVFVWLRHTRDIERESGGFGRYLQNQNATTRFSWNYGRPTADYRDRFQAAATEALKEGFETLSVTFETDKVQSRAAAEYGWRITPYAYLLLKARGPHVDKLPPLRIDLDFLDTSGYVVLPIESAAVPLDARAAHADGRPARKVQVTQTLDERQAAQGKLGLEIKASALGLVPDLDRLLNLAPEGFNLGKTEDQGVSVAKFDPDSDPLAVSTERTWLLTFQAKPDLPKPPEKFRFGEAKQDGVAMTYQRYQDADLAAAAPEVDLVEHYGRRSYTWAWWSAGAALVLLGLTAWAARRLRRRRPAAERWRLPEPLTPFTAIALLERIRAEGGLDEPGRQKIDQSIRRLEERYFAEADGAPNGDGAAELRDVTLGWLREAR